MWNLRNKTDEHRGEKRKPNQEMGVFTIENKLKVTAGEVDGGMD